MAAAAGSGRSPYSLIHLFSSYLISDLLKWLTFGQAVRDLRVCFFLKTVFNLTILET